MSRYLYKKIQNISPESLNFQHSGLKLTTLGSDPMKYLHHWNTHTILLTEMPLPLSELQIHGVLFLKYRLFPKNSRCQCILMKTQTIHWKQEIHWKTWKFSRMLWEKLKDFWSGNKKKHIIILSRCAQRSVKKLFLDTSFCQMW